MHPTHRAIVLMALACGFLALAGEDGVHIIRGLRMPDDLALSALCLLAAVALAMWLIFVEARAEPKDPVRVRIDDQKTWRREPENSGVGWGHIVGIAGLALEFYLLAPLVMPAG